MYVKVDLYGSLVTEIVMYNWEIWGININTDLEQFIYHL